MVRFSTIRGCPVICGDRRLGILQDIALDTAQKRVQALIVSCGLKGKCVIPRSSILCLTGDFILADGYLRFRRSEVNERIHFVRDTSGLLSGYVRDYVIDEETLYVSALQIALGHLPSQKKQRIWLYAFMRSDSQRNELTIPVLLGLQTTQPREETE